MYVYIYIFHKEKIAKKYLNCKTSYFLNIVRYGLFGLGVDIWIYDTFSEDLC